MSIYCTYVSICWGCEHLLRCERVFDLSGVVTTLVYLSSLLFLLLLIYWASCIEEIPYTCIHKHIHVRAYLHVCTHTCWYTGTHTYTSNLWILWPVHIMPSSPLDRSQLSLSWIQTGTLMYWRELQDILYLIRCFKDPPDNFFIQNLIFFVHLHPRCTVRNKLQINFSKTSCTLKTFLLQQGS